MTSTVTRVFHVSAFCWYAFVVKILAAKDGEKLPAGIFVYGGPWKYLTFLNLVSVLHVCRYKAGWCGLGKGMLLVFQLLQMAFFGLAAVSDLQAEKNSESTLSRCKDLLFAVFAFPVGMVWDILHI